MTLEKQVERGIQARRIIEDPIYEEAWEMTERAFYEMWRDVDWRDEKAMQGMKRMQSAAFHFRQMLEQIINTGDWAQNELNSLQEDE